MNNKTKSFQSVYDDYQFLEELKAPPKLILHVKLVGESAELIISKLRELGVHLDESLVRLGVAFHDVGKMLHPEELITKGNNHEAAGEALLFMHGVDPKLARCCRSHAQWQIMECSLEELCIALADTLWKGKRISQLEELFIKALAKLRSKDYWDLFIEMDSSFETIALEGDSRLSRSQVL